MARKDLYGLCRARSAPPKVLDHETTTNIEANPAEQTQEGEDNYHDDGEDYEDCEDCKGSPRLRLAGGLRDSVHLTRTGTSMS